CLSLSSSFFHCFVALRDLHSFPTRRSSDLQPCSFTIHFPTLVYTGYFDFPSFFLFLLAFCIKSVNFNEDNFLVKGYGLFRYHFCIQKLLTYCFMTNHRIT